MRRTAQSHEKHHGYHDSEESRPLIVSVHHICDVALQKRDGLNWQVSNHCSTPGSHLLQVYLCEQQIHYLLPRVKYSPGHNDSVFVLLLFLSRKNMYAKMNIALFDNISSVIMRAQDNVDQTASGPVKYSGEYLNWNR